MSADSLIAEANKLSAAERLRIAEAIWQSAWDEQENLPLTNEQRDELDRRMADYQANPEAGSTWDEVRSRIEQKL